MPTSVMLLLRPLSRSARHSSRRNSSTKSNLVQQNIDFSGLKPEDKEALLRYLNPFEESYNERHDITTCLVGFDFDGFAKVAKVDADKAETQFKNLWPRWSLQR